MWRVAMIDAMSDRVPSAVCSGALTRSTWLCRSAGSSACIAQSVSSCDDNASGVQTQPTAGAAGWQRLCSPR